MKYLYLYYTDPKNTGTEIDKYIQNKRTVFRKFVPVQVPIDDGIRLLRSGMFKSLNDNDLDKHYAKYGSILEDAYNILIIRDEGIGDLIMTTPTLRAIKERSPKSTITYATNLAYKFLLENNPYVDNIIGIEEIKRTDFSQIHDLRNCSEKSPIRNTHHRIFTYAHKIGIEIPEGKETAILNITADIIDRAKKLIGYTPEKKYVLMQLGATHFCRLWHEGKFLTLAERLIADGYTVVYVDKDKSGVEVNGLLNLTGETNIKDLVGLIAVCDLTVCSDTGAYHIAGALGKAFVALFGIISPKFRTVYYDCWHEDVIPEGMTCLGCGDYHMEKCTITGTEIAKCMDTITVEQVYKACSKFLKDEYKRVEVTPCMKPDVPQVSNVAKKINKFTLAMICLNEESYLKRLIPNLFGHPSIKRIVAIDGGSTDNTKAVLTEAGAEVYTHLWQHGYHDAVALQRNIMASYIPEGERFMFIDPDEICSKELLARLNEIMGMSQRYICLSRRTFKSYAGSVKYYESGDGSEQHLHYPDFQPRVYTNDRFLKFFRSPHHLTLNIGEPKNILGADILHYEKDIEVDNKKIDKQWTDLVEAGRKLGLESWYVDHTTNRK